MITDHLEKLKHFVGIVKFGSIRKYANRQQLSQPAISKSMQNLEAALEVSLFIRGRDGILLTQAGQELYKWADRSLGEAAEVEKSLRRQSNLKLGGQLRMGTYQSIAVYFAPKFFKFIQGEQENINIHLTCGQSAELFELLKSGRLDFIVSIDPPQSRDITSSILFEDFYSIYRAKDSSRTLASSPIFTLPLAKDKHGVTIENHLRRADITRNLVSAGDFEAARAMVQSDVGLAILPERVAKALIDSKRIEELRLPAKLRHFGPHTVAFSCKKHRADDASLKWIASQLHLLLRSDF